MPEKVGESPYLTYIDPGLNKDDIQTVIKWMTNRMKDITDRI